MRLVKAAKASPHAKFYNLSTGYSPSPAPPGYATDSEQKINLQ